MIFADEATGNLDSKTSDEIIDLLLKLNTERNVTMMLVTHDPEIASLLTNFGHARWTNY